LRLDLQISPNFFFTIFILCYILWAWNIGKGKRDGNFIKYFFPFILHEQKKNGITKLPNLFLIYVFLIILQNIIFLIFGTPPGLYIILLTLFIVFESYLIFSYAAHLTSKRHYFIIPFTLTAVLTVFALILCFAIRSYDPMDAIDYFTLLIKLSGCILVISTIYLKDKIPENIDGLFIIVGFAAFFSLQLYNSIYLVFKGNESDFVNAYSLLFVYGYWIISVPLLRRLKCKFS